jgi:hypothetical protein
LAGSAPKPCRPKPLCKPHTEEHVSYNISSYQLILRMILSKLMALRKVQAQVDGDHMNVQD